MRKIGYGLGIVLVVAAGIEGAKKHHETLTPPAHTVAPHATAAHAAATPHATAVHVSVSPSPVAQVIESHNSSFWAQVVLGVLVLAIVIGVGAGVRWMRLNPRRPKTRAAKLLRARSAICGVVAGVLGFFSLVTTVSLGGFSSFPTLLGIVGAMAGLLAVGLWFASLAVHTGSRFAPVKPQARPVAARRVPASSVAHRPVPLPNRAPAPVPTAPTPVPVPAPVAAPVPTPAPMPVAVP